MKRMFAIILILGFLLPFTMASATCSHNNITAPGDAGHYSTYAQYTNSHHWQTTYMKFKCLDCGYSYTMQWNTDYFPHEFAGDTCTLCGYTRGQTIVCTHEGWRNGEYWDAYEKYSDTKHAKITYVDWYCIGCGDEWTEENSRTYEAHEFLGSKCTLCGYSRSNSSGCAQHPSASVKSQKIPYYSWEDANYHRQYWVCYQVCSICESILADEGDIAADNNELHSFSNNKCTKCGYSRSESNLPSSVPSMDELQYAARQLGNQAIGATAKVVYAGNVRDTASNTALIVGKVQADETYDILSYQVATNGSIWYEIKFGRRTVWLSAGLVEVIPSISDTVEVPSDFVGRQLVITIMSGSTRTAPGTSSNRAGSIYRGERYTIYNCDYDIDGKLWYQIRLGREYCWISSNVAELQ